MKRVVFDENMPRQLRRELPEFYIRTVQEEGWAGLANGRLPESAEGRFDVLVTADQRLLHQQNIPTFNIAVIVIKTHDTRVRNLRHFLPQLKAAIAGAAAGRVVVLTATP